MLNERSLCPNRNLRLNNMETPMDNLDCILADVSCAVMTEGDIASSNDFILPLILYIDNTRVRNKYRDRLELEAASPTAYKTGTVIISTAANEMGNIK